MSPLHLIWIIPISVMFGFIICALLVNDGRDCVQCMEAVDEEEEGAECG